MGKHSAGKGKPVNWPREQQVTPDPKDPKYDQPKTFGKGWNR